jgi:hypothetical protein
MDNHLLSRLGTFFLLMGFGFIILFIGSVFARELNLVLLLFSAIALFLGFKFHRSAPRHESSRFSGIRKASQRSRQNREDEHTMKAERK